MDTTSYRERSPSLPSKAQAVTQEFHLSITPLGADTYWLRTEAVASGVPLAEAQVVWPLDTWLAQTEALFQDPLQALLQSPTEARLDNAWMGLGQALYNGLFQGRIRDSWLAAQGVAQNHRQPLRLRLGFKDSRVQRLPWELLYGDDRPLATGLDVTLCRYYQGQTVTDLAAMAPLAPASVPLRALVAIAAPNDQDRLALRQEVQRLVETLQIAPVDASTLALDITILEQPGRPELVQALEQGNFQIFHYAGHSDIGDTGETGGSLYLVNRQNGLSEKLSGGDLAGLLVNNGTRLAVFNSCRGAYTPQDDAQANWLDQNLVQALVNRGVPGVIAMADRIPDDVALTFTQLLYRNLHQGHPIDLCLSRVRQGLMSAYGSGQPFWMLPLLYLRADFDGYLYEGDRPALDIFDALGDADLKDVALLAPDYDSDPDMTSLAADILSPAANGGGNHGWADNQTPEEFTPLYDWLPTLAAPDAAADTAVTNLVQQLSGPAIHPPKGLLAADLSENLLPPPTQIPHPQHLPPQPAAASPPPAVRGRVGKPRPAIPVNLLAWGGLGLAGLGVVLGLALVTLSTTNRPSAPDLIPLPNTSEANRPTAAAPSATLVESSIAALNLGNTETARDLLEQLLDRGDLVSAEAVLETVPGPLRDNSQIAYVQGRLQWQQATSGSNPDASPHDALRSWVAATEGDPTLVEAWVALGFAHYALGDYPEAIKTWDRAIAIDESNRRDINPAAPQVNNPIAVNAYAGLAMAYRQESAITLLPEEQLPFEQQAQAYFRQVLALNPRFASHNALAVSWLWSQALLSDWQETVIQLAKGGISSETPPPN
jgi:tetratricopeptide (TPR) repeat protein